MDNVSVVSHFLLREAARCRCLPAQRPRLAASRRRGSRQTEEQRSLAPLLRHGSFNLTRRPLLFHTIPLLPSLSCVAEEEKEEEKKEEKGQLDVKLALLSDIFRWLC
ncbi:unnamed protein product [Merluccius merluccius]